MKFGEKLKQLRVQNHLTQGALAKDLGVSLRTLQNYETCKIYPKQTEIYARIAKKFGVSADYLLTGEEQFLSDAAAMGGRTGLAQAQALIGQVGGLFAGGTLSEEDKDKVLCAINDLYWEAKRNNKKYAGKD